MNENVQGFRARLNETLCCEDVLDFAGADTERQRAERAVSGRVAVAANKGLPGLRDTQLRSNDVYDALILAVHVKEADAGFAAVFLQSFKLELGIVIEYGQRAVGGGNGMVHHRESEIGAANFAAFRAETGEGLGRGALMDEGAVNIDDHGLAGWLVNDMGVPDFLIERFRRHGSSLEF